jgi:hypothetical protein
VRSKGSVYGEGRRCTLGPTRIGTKEMFHVAHAKDKGAKDKHVKKKAQQSIKEKRAAKKMKKEGGARPAFGGS